MKDKLPAADSVGILPAYSYGFEPQPGVIWRFRGQGKFAAQVREADLLSAK